VLTTTRLLSDGPRCGAGTPLNARQRAVINRLLNGFEGKLTSSKWAALTKRSQDTALRDIDDLVKRGIRTRGVAGVEAPAIRWRKAQELESIKQRS
jgi:DeoR/GlpR family transcriptional regulator of sugar metabolism